MIARPVEQIILQFADIPIIIITFYIFIATLVIPTTDSSSAGSTNATAPP